MNQHKHLWWKRAIVIALSFVVTSFVLLFFSPVSQAGFWNQIQLLFKRVPPSTLPTDRSAGGAGRGPACVLAEEEYSNDSTKSLLALMPVIKVDSEGKAISNGQRNITHN